VVAYLLDSQRAPWVAQIGKVFGAGHGLLSFRVDQAAEVIRIFDILWIGIPREIAYYVPQERTNGEPCQLNDLTMTSDGTIYVTDRAGNGLYILQPQVDFGQPACPAAPLCSAWDGMDDGAGQLSIM
jgi:sugar lactone lactonase YvrE